MSLSSPARSMEAHNPDVKGFYEVLEHTENFPLESIGRKQVAPDFVPLYSKKGPSLPSISNSNTMQAYLHEAVSSKATTPGSGHAVDHGAFADGAASPLGGSSPKTSGSPLRSSWPRKASHDRSSPGAVAPGRTGSSTRMWAQPSSQGSQGIATPPQTNRSAAPQGGGAAASAWAIPAVMASGAPGTAPAGYGAGMAGHNEFAGMGSFDLDAAQRVMARMKALEDFVRSKMGGSLPSAEAIQALSTQVGALQEQAQAQEGRGTVIDAELSALASAEAMAREEARAAREEAKAAREETKAARAALSKMAAALTKLEGKMATRVEELGTALERQQAQQAQQADEKQAAVQAALQQQGEKVAAAAAAAAAATKAAEGAAKTAEGAVRAAGEAAKASEQLGREANAAAAEAQARLGELEAQVQAQQQQASAATEAHASALAAALPGLGALTSRVNAIEAAHAQTESAAAAAAEAAAAAAARLDAQDARLAQLTGEEQGVEARVEALEGAARRAEAAVAGVIAKLDAQPDQSGVSNELRSQVDALDQKVAGAVQALSALDERLAAEQATGSSREEARARAEGETAARVSAIEATVSQLRAVSEQQSAAASTAVTTAAVDAAVGPLQQQLSALQASLSELQGGLEAARQQGQEAAAAAQSLLGRLDSLETRHTDGVGALAERCAAVEVVAEKLEKALSEQQQGFEGVAELSVHLQEVEVMVKELAAHPAVPAPAAALDASALADVEVKIAEAHDDAVGRLEDMKVKMTPVLQLLVKKVKALEQALGETVDLEGLETDASGTGAIKPPAASAGQQQQVAELQAEMTRRLDELEHATVNKIEALQTKVSSVLQLLVARVKSLEAKGKAYGADDAGSTSGSLGLAAAASGLESVPE